MAQIAAAATYHATAHKIEALSILKILALVFAAATAANLALLLLNERCSDRRGVFRLVEASTFAMCFNTFAFLAWRDALPARHFAWVAPVLPIAVPLVTFSCLAPWGGRDQLFVGFLLAVGAAVTGSLTIYFWMFATEFNFLALILVGPIPIPAFVVTGVLFGSCLLALPFGFLYHIIRIFCGVK